MTAQLSTVARSPLPILVSTRTIQDCIDADVDADNTRDGWSPLRHGHDEIKAHLEGLASDWNLQQPKSAATAFVTYGVLITIESCDMPELGKFLHVTTNQNHYHRLAKESRES